MAGNPALCLSRQEWTRRFSTFVREATPESLLGSSIYFDLRVVWGPELGCRQLNQHLLAEIADNSLFQRQLAANALRHRPPLGRFRDFVVARKGAEKDTLDLKEEGLTPFVDGAVFDHHCADRQQVVALQVETTGLQVHHHQALLGQWSLVQCCRGGQAQAAWVDDGAALAQPFEHLPHSW